MLHGQTDSIGDHVVGKQFVPVDAQRVLKSVVSVPEALALHVGHSDIVMNDV